MKCTTCQRNTDDVFYVCQRAYCAAHWKAATIAAYPKPNKAFETRCNQSISRILKSRKFSDILPGQVELWG